MKKKTFEEVKQDFLKHGYTLLEENYKDRKTKMKIKNKEGYITLATYHSLHETCIRNGKELDMFSKYNPYMIDNIKLFLEKDGNNTQLISNMYKDMTTKLNLICGCCGKPFNRSFIKLQTASTLCKSCSSKKGQENRNPSLEEKMKLLNNFNLKPLQDISNVIMLEYISVVDKDGYKYRTTLARLTKEDCKKLNIIGTTNPYSVENINNYFKLNNIKLKALSFKSAREDVELECECGDIFYRVFDVVKKGSHLCSKCMRLHESSYSEKTRLFLEERKINFVTEKKFDTCRYKTPLRFDYYLPDFNLLIEVDGQQHFFPVKLYTKSEEEAEEQFKLRKKRDEIKNKWCKKNNVPLLRIPYYEFENDNYIKMLNKFIYNIDDN